MIKLKRLEEEKTPAGNTRIGDCNQDQRQG
jgi:hypothetical protein